MIEVALFGASNDSPFVEGMTISLQPFNDGEYPGLEVSGGKVNQVGQKKRSVRFPNNSGSGENVFEFFGFKSTMNAKKISNISILTYDPEELYKSRYNWVKL